MNSPTIIRQAIKDDMQAVVITVGISAFFQTYRINGFNGTTSLESSEFYSEERTAINRFEAWV